MTIDDVLQYLGEIAPLSYQLDFDNAGLLVGDREQEVTKVLVSLDSTEEVVEEALEKDCNLIISHHPIIFKGLKKLTGTNHVERTVMKAIQHNIALYATHTNLDRVPHGVNGKIADKLGLTSKRILAPSASENSNNNPGTGSDSSPEDVGLGMVGELTQPMEEMSFLTHLKTTMKTGCVRYTALTGQTVNTVAVCGGAGGFLLDEAKRANADVFVTSDYKYHDFFDAEGELVIADIGHYESEQFTIELLSDLLTQKFPNFATLQTEINTNPVKYL